ncbi:MAG: nicotinamide mononucleotide transporter [Bryobacterales bacterium]|nr:nicotinamide mononucleotide transporter [Bryobacterales bacterium]
MPSLVEWLGFLTGAACVWLVVQRNVWNYPVGIANCLFFLVLFTRSRLYGDAGLQIVYIILNAHGWYLWLRGGPTHTGLTITRSGPRLLLLMGAFVVAATFGLRTVLRMAGGAAPWMDALTTALSLAAQILQNRKKLEHWWFWITADIFYVYLYIARDLWLTSVLYAVFLAMCIVGLRTWRAELRK